MIDKNIFFKKVNTTLFRNKLSEKQKDGMSAILDEWNKRKYSDPRMLAYVFATAYHETAQTMQPIRESGGVSYLTKNYDIKGKNPSRAKSMGNTSIGDGVKYCGRGFCQLTWKNNYQKFGKNLGIDLIGNPDLALNMEIAAKIILTGMMDPNCSFSGTVLSRYINSKETNFIYARKTVNGLDRAQLIAGYANGFLSSLSGVI